MKNEDTDQTSAPGKLPLDPTERDEYIQELREKNRSFFKKYFEAIFDRLDTHEPESELVFLENGEPDVLFNGIYFYNKKGAYSHSQEQLDDFLETPTRFSTGIMDGIKSDSDTARFAYDMNLKCEEKGLKFDERHTSTRAFHLHVFGIGLGTFIHELVEKAQCESLLLYEVNFELFYHSLSVTDWHDALREFVENAKQKFLKFAISTDENVLVSTLTSSIRLSNPATADGLMTYHHYKNASFVNAHKKLAKGDFEISMLGLGFYEDEFHMLSNAYKNLAPGNVRVFKQHAATIDVPVLICANGPSLDMLMPFIKKNQKKAIIVCCGSALDSLLHHGVKPDFHVMIERSSLLMFDQKVSASKWKIDDICFVGATNIFPGVPDFHKDKILFFRGGICPRSIFATNDEQVPSNSDPLVANAALMFAISAGFRDVYFCGVDVGAKDPEYHHSKDSQYTTRKIKYEFTFDRTAPGNFGGTVRTTNILMWSRRHLKSAISTFFRRHNYFNLSDGALIDGARPKHHSKVTFAPLKGKKKLVREVIESFPVYNRDEFDEAWAKADLENRLVEVKDQLVEIIEENDLKDFAYLTKFIPVLKSGKTGDPVAMIYRGTIHHMLMHIFTHMERAPDEETKIEFEKSVKEVFPIHANHLCNEMLERIEDLKNDTVDWEVGCDLNWRRPWQEEFRQKAGIPYEDEMAQYLVDHDQPEENGS